MLPWAYVTRTVISFLAGVIFTWSFPGPHCMGLLRDPGVQEIFVTWESVSIYFWLTLEHKTRVTVIKYTYPLPAADCCFK